LHIVGGGDGTAQANDDINVVWSRDWSDGFHQQIDIRRIARHEKVGFQPLNCQHPAQLPGEVAVLAPRQHRMEGLLVGLSGCIRSPAWANSFSAARFGNRASTRPMA